MYIVYKYMYIVYKYMYIVYKYIYITHILYGYFMSTNGIVKRLQWSRGERAGLWYPSSQVRTRPKPSDFSGEKILSAPSFRGEV